MAFLFQGTKCFTLGQGSIGFFITSYCFYLQVWQKLLLLAKKETKIAVFVENIGYIGHLLKI